MGIFLNALIADLSKIGAYVGLFLFIKSVSPFYAYLIFGLMLINMIATVLLEVHYSRLADKLQNKLTNRDN